MLEIHCAGTPYEIGRQHGEAAQNEIKGGLKFYSEYFQTHARMDWATATMHAEKFLPVLTQDWPEFVEEMKGIAEGSEVPFSSILAMNVRTEISMGMMSDGCTALAWKTSNDSFLAQNWDWEADQRNNLVALHIRRTSKPSISQITEAGIIGKIGLNSSGVGVCLNAIRTKGVDFSRLPCHLALRAALDSTSRSEAIAKIENAGVASSAHILIADSTGAISMESSFVDIKKLEMKDGRIAHTNHYLVPRPGADPSAFSKDSFARMIRVTELMDEASSSGQSLTMTVIDGILSDEQNYPTSINRNQSEGSTLCTLFSIIMDLPKKTATVKIGRPTQSEGTILLQPKA